MFDLARSGLSCVRAPGPVVGSRAAFLRSSTRPTHTAGTIRTAPFGSNRNTAAPSRCPPDAIATSRAASTPVRRLCSASDAFESRTTALIAGTPMPSTIAMIASTTNSSVSVKPRRPGTERAAEQGLGGGVGRLMIRTSRGCPAPPPPAAAPGPCSRR